MRAEELSGLLVIDKPAGLTSHDVVLRVRRAARQRKVGHAGTLDPMATGVLVLLLGQATKVSEYLMAHAKTYRALVRLGISTDTYDAEGEVTETRPVEVSLSQIEEALSTFRGRIEQVPPMYSAIKRGGTPLYRLARQGMKVERKPRLVEIYRLQVLNWSPPDLELEVECSSGTYIRSLAHDLGEKLGCGAHLAGLVRTRCGPFTLEEALSLPQVEEAFARGRGGELLRPLDEGLTHWPAITVGARDAQRICHGQRVKGPKPGESRYRRAYSEDGEFIAILKWDASRGLWQPKKVFKRPTPRKGSPRGPRKGT